MKKKLNRERFLAWYFSDEDDLLIFARDVLSKLEDASTITVTCQSLLDQCGYIPAFLIDGDDSGAEYDPSECEFEEETL